MLRFSLKPFRDHRGTCNKRTMNVWTLLYLLESVNHDASRAHDLKLSIEDRNEYAVRRLLDQPDKYTKTYLEHLIPPINVEIQCLESDLKRPIKNVGGVVLGACIIGCNLWGNIGLLGFGLGYSCFMYSLWSYPKQLKLRQLHNIKQMVEQMIISSK
jgi:hypothetical protein